MLDDLSVLGESKTCDVVTDDMQSCIEDGKGVIGKGNCITMIQIQVSLLEHELFLPQFFAKLDSVFRPTGQ